MSGKDKKPGITFGSHGSKDPKKDPKQIGGTADSGDRGDGPLFVQAGGNQASQSGVAPVGPYSPEFLDNYQANLADQRALGPYAPEYGGYGFSPYGMGGLAGISGIGAAVAAAAQAAAQSAAQAAAERQWGEATTTKMEDVYNPDGSLKKEIPANAVLYVGYGPEDKEYLDLNGESATLGEKAEVVTLFNPTDEVLQSLLKDTGVETVVVGGHGKDGSIFTVEEDGKSRERSGKEFASLFEGTKVQEVFMNICEGAKGATSVANELQNLGMAVLGWAEEVSDKDAISAADTLVKMTNLMATGATPADLQKVADQFDGPGGRLILRAIKKVGPDPEAIAKALAELEMYGGFGGFYF